MLPIVIERITEARLWISTRREATAGRVGFIPTMGALHPGHVSLIQKARQSCQTVVVSIFVNPTQFNNPEDLKKYPRTLEKDLNVLRQAGCDMLFLPSVEEMYPKLTKEHWDFGRLSNSLEGEFRPGHFDGVLTVVKKLFEIVEPDQAFFGEKDFQQLALIRKMTEFEGLPVEVIGSPLIRENDGLAMSSRNLRLSKDERNQSLAISHALKAIHDKQRKLSPEQTIHLAKSMLQQAGIQVEYLAIVEAATFEPIMAWDQVKMPIALFAGYVGEIRLIDNCFL